MIYIIDPPALAALFLTIACSILLSIATALVPDALQFRRKEIRGINNQILQRGKSVIIAVAGHASPKIKSIRPINEPRRRGVRRGKQSLTLKIATLSKNFPSHFALLRLLIPTFPLHFNMVVHTHYPRGAAIQSVVWAATTTHIHCTIPPGHIPLLLLIRLMPRQSTIQPAKQQTTNYFVAAPF